MARKGNQQKNGLANKKGVSGGVLPKVYPGEGMKGHAKGGTQVKVYPGEELANGDSPSHFSQSGSEVASACDDISSEQNYEKSLRKEKQEEFVKHDMEESVSSGNDSGGGRLNHDVPIQEENGTLPGSDLGQQSMKSRLSCLLDGLKVKSLVENAELADRVIIRRIRLSVLSIFTAVTGWLTRQKPLFLSFANVTLKTCDNLRMKIKKAYPVLLKWLMHLGNIMLLLSVFWLDCAIRGFDSFVRMGTTSFFSVIWCSVFSVISMIGMLKFLVVLRWNNRVGPILLNKELECTLNQGSLMMRQHSLPHNTNHHFFISANGYPSFSSSFLPLSIRTKPRRKSASLVVSAHKKDNKDDSHSFVSNPNESTGFFPEKSIQEDGKVLPEFEDAEERQLFEALMLELDSDTSVDQMHHYEMVYLIHEKHEEQVAAVNEKIQDFLREKKGTVWRFSDWGMRRLAYKIKKAKNAHYILMNFELDAKYINEFKTMLDQDERVIRHLVIKRDEAITEDCPPPPEFHTLRAGADDDYDDEGYETEYDEDFDDDWDGEDDDDGEIIIVDDDDDDDDDDDHRNDKSANMKHDTAR